MKSCDQSRLKESFSQARRAAFTHFVVSRLVFPGLTEASIPAYAASFEAFENLEISPISPGITAALATERKIHLPPRDNYIHLVAGEVNYPP